MTPKTESKIMNITVDENGLHIRIPNDILARTELTLEEKYVLTQIRDLPGCGNHPLSTVLGITVSGVEAMLSRLRRERHIEMLGEGKARTHRVLPQDGDQNKSGQPHSNGLTPKKSGHPSKSEVGVIEEEYDRARKCLATQVLSGQLCSQFVPFQQLLQRVSSDTALSTVEAASLIERIEDDITRTMILDRFADEIARTFDREGIVDVFKALFSASHPVLVQIRPQLGTASEASLLNIFRAISDDNFAREAQAVERQQPAGVIDSATAQSQASPPPVVDTKPKPKPGGVPSLKERLAAQREREKKQE
jgi:hypothetical protein